jgi:hypothetical protein
MRFWIERMLRRYRCRGRQLGANTARLTLIYITSCGCVCAMFTSDLPDPCLRGPRKILESKPKHHLGRNRSMGCSR